MPPTPSKHGFASFGWGGAVCIFLDFGHPPPCCESLSERGWLARWMDIYICLLLQIVDAPGADGRWGNSMW